MSKIDLSRAQIGDKFRTKDGQILEYIGKNFECAGVNCEYYDDKYELTNKHGFIRHFFQYGGYLYNEENNLDLVEQVFDDEKDRAITDKILKDVETVVNGVAVAMPLIESAAIVNLLREQLPENNEDDAELQRRQEVVELAEKMYTMLEVENVKYYLVNNGNYAFESKDLVEVAFIRAASFVNKKHKYLKDGKLC